MWLWIHFAWIIRKQKNTTIIICTLQRMKCCQIFLKTFSAAMKMHLNFGPLPLAWVFLSGLLIGQVHSEGACLQDGMHKTTPGPEPQLTECSLYADSELLLQTQDDRSSTTTVLNLWVVTQKWVIARFWLGFGFIVEIFSELFPNFRKYKHIYKKYILSVLSIWRTHNSTEFKHFNDLFSRYDRK